MVSHFAPAHRPSGYWTGMKKLGYLSPSASHLASVVDPRPEIVIIRNDTDIAEGVQRSCRARGSRC